MILEENENKKEIYETIILKYAIQNILGLVLNHKLIRIYKHILNITTIKRQRKDYHFLEQKKKTCKQGSIPN